MGEESVSTEHFVGEINCRPPGICVGEIDCRPPGFVGEINCLPPGISRAPPETLDLTNTCSPGDTWSHQPSQRIVLLRRQKPGGRQLISPTRAPPETLDLTNTCSSGDTWSHQPSQSNHNLFHQQRYQVQVSSNTLHKKSENLDFLWTLMNRWSKKQDGASVDFIPKTH